MTSASRAQPFSGYPEAPALNIYNAEKPSEWIDMAVIDNLMAKLHKFFHLPPAERRLFLIAGFLQMMMRLGLWLLPFLSLMRVVDRLGRRQNLLQPDPLLPEKIAWAVNAACPFVPRSTCLTRALVARIMLKRGGFPADLRIGVAKGENGQFQAHAWVESGGSVIIGGTEHENYVLFRNIGTSDTFCRSCGSD